MINFEQGRHSKVLNEPQQFGRFLYKDVMLFASIAVAGAVVMPILVSLLLAAITYRLTLLFRHSEHGDLTQKIRYSHLPSQDDVIESKIERRYKVLPPSHVREIIG